MADLDEIRSNYDDADSRLDDAQVVMGMIEDAMHFHYTNPEEAMVAQQRLAILLPLLTAAIDDAREIICETRPLLTADKRTAKEEVPRG